MKAPKPRSEGPEYMLDSDVVPMPERKQRGGVAIYFPFAEMEVGRSFRTQRSMDTLKTAVRRFVKGEGMEGRKYMVRDIADLPGWRRCWRET